MKKFDLITRNHDDLYDLMNRFFDRGFPLARAFTDIKVDVQEKEHEYMIEADMPGIKKEDITLQLSNDYLQIAVQQVQQSENDDKNYLRKERVSSSLRRDIYLPNTTKEGIKAKLESGVLTITVPKAQPHMTKTSIEIE